MLTHRQRSFIATVVAPEGCFNFLDQVLGTPALLDGKPAAAVNTPSLADVVLAKFGRGIWARRFAKHAAPEKPKPAGSDRRDESHYLGYGDNVSDAEPLTLYFRSVEKGYRLFVRSKVRYGLGLYVHAENCVCALKTPHDGKYSTVFELLDENNSLLDYETLQDQTNFRLSVAGRRTPLMLRTFRGIPYTYICTEGASPLELSMSIVERNAAYLNDPDEV